MPEINMGNAVDIVASQEPEIEMTVQDIIDGSKREYRVKIVSDNPTWNGKIMVVRGLSVGEHEQIARKVALDDDATVADKLKFGIEACKIGIVNKDIASIANKLDPSIIDQIAEKIMGNSKKKEQAVKDFLSQEPARP